MRKGFGAWALGAGVLHLAVLAAQSGITNAVAEPARAGGAIQPEVSRLAARGRPTWIGYRVPVAAGDQRFCEAPELEPSTDLLVMARVDRTGISRMRLFTPDCAIDAGGLPFVWLGDVQPDASVAWLETLARACARDATAARSQVARPALTALGLHGTAAASAALIALAGADSPSWLRREAVQWLARSKEPHAVQFFEQILQ